MILLLSKVANYKFVLFFFVLTAWMSFVTFPKYEKMINDLAGQKIEALDGRMHYTLDEVIDSFDKAGEKGRAKYAYVLKVVDTIFPFVYGFFFISAIAFFMKKINPKLIGICFLPLVAMMFDFLENRNTLKMLNQYPEILTSDAEYGSLMSMLKWIFVYLSIALLLVEILIFIWLKFKNRRTSH